MSWATVGAITGIASVASGIYGSYQAGRAADAQVAAGDRALALQTRQYDNSLELAEPARGLGYGAMQDIGSVLGYGVPAYPTLDSLQSGGGGGGQRGVLTVDGNTRTYGGSINFDTGEVTVNVPGEGYRDDALSQQATAALRAGQLPGDGAWSRFSEAFSQAQGAGYKYAPPAAPGQAGSVGQTTPSMARFEASPDYQFRRDEGQRDIDNSSTARGAGGDALRALTTFNQSLASSEFGDWLNRRLAVAGMNQVATASAIDSGNRYATTASNTVQGQGDARASGIVGGANSIANGVNAAGNTFLWGKYLNGLNAGGTYGTWNPGAASLPGGGTINPNLPYITG